MYTVYTYKCMALANPTYVQGKKRSTTASTKGVKRQALQVLETVSIKEAGTAGA